MSASERLERYWPYVIVISAASSSHEGARKIGTPAIRPSRMPEPRSWGSGRAFGDAGADAVRCSSIAPDATWKEGRNQFLSYPPFNLWGMTVPVTSAPEAALPTLSPSRAADFRPARCSTGSAPSTACRSARPPTRPAARLSTPCSRVLFDSPAGSRTLEQAAALTAPQWARLVEEEPELASIFTGSALTLEQFLVEARELLGGYFSLEDPNRLEPADREAYVEATVDERLVIRGIIDRLDVSRPGTSAWSTTRRAGRRGRRSRPGPCSS
ncbi:hypothetical protein GCM10020218_057340 [Dactylosporangium vinaceum]